MSITYCIMSIIQGTVRTIISIRVCPESSFSSEHVSLSFAKTAFIFGAKNTFLNVSGLLLTQFTYFLIMTKLGPAVLAVFARPVSLINHVNNFLLRFTFILTPMAGSIDKIHGPEELKNFAVTSSKFSYAFTLPMISLFCIHGDEVIKIWMGEDYVNKNIILWLGLGFLLPISQNALKSVLTGLDQHGRASIISISCSMFLFCVLVLLLPEDPSVEDMVVVFVLPLTIVEGLIIPAYVVYKLGITPLIYLNEVFLKVSLIFFPALMQLLYFSWVLKVEGLWILVSIGFYGIVLLVFYWHYLLTFEMKSNAIQYVKKIVVQLLNISPAR